MFFSFIFFGIKTVTGTLVYGFSEYLSGDIKPYYHSYGFETQLNTDIYYLHEASYRGQSLISKAYDENRTSIINEAVNNYLNQKAGIIYNELTFAVENYDESYFLYEYTADAVDIPEDYTMTINQETTTSNSYSDNNEPLTDKNGERIPRNVEAAKKVLENYTGIELLPFDALVRDSAFTENTFYYSSSLWITSDYETEISLSNSYEYDETEIRKNFLAQYENQKENEAASAESMYDFATERLSTLKSIKYFITLENGNIETNAGNNITEDDFKNNAKSFRNYMFSDGTGTSLPDFSDNMQNNIRETFSDIGNNKILFYIDTETLNESNDSYAYLYDIYNSMLSSDAVTNISVALISVIISFILLIIFLCLCGHKGNNGEENTALIDRLPTDIHFILSIGIVAGLTVLGSWLAIEFIENTSELYTKIILMYAPVSLGVIFTLSYLIFTEWLASTVRIKKNGQKFFANMIISKGITSLWKLLKKGTKSIRNFISAFGYKPKKMKRTVILIAVGYIFGNFLIIFAAQLLSYFIHSSISIFIGIITSIIYNSVCIYFILQYLIKLDKIIDASSRHESVNFGNENIPASLSILASNLTNTNEALTKAIEKAVRDEQMKTELITNVSHDLKTPLTSLISYSDLLSKCEITNETASKYISVINTQSIKLKRLIEDLIEASKVSTGNVTLNTTKLNLSELAMQAIAEFAPEMEKNGNEIRFSEPESPPSIFADGSKTYRILANLLSNAKKYSAPGTRIYISVYTDKINSYFEIKNISCEPLNISAEELTERFVRGDKSRTKEGNGLGLSIAKDLCTLQGGNLNLFIDGDLFKAIISLPYAGELNS